MAKALSAGERICEVIKQAGYCACVGTPKHQIPLMDWFAECVCVGDRVSVHIREWRGRVTSYTVCIWNGDTAKSWRVKACKTQGEVLAALKEEEGAL